jgi:general secretion pathway protein G
MRGRRRQSGEAGFTLIELLIVVALIGILTSLALPTFKNAQIKAKEAVLKENLFILRDLIDQYYADKGFYPADLQVLVEEDYIRKIPEDPFTEEADYETIASDTDASLSLGGQGGGIWDVRSLSTGTALDGSSYSEW